jgi:hypothetical protein
MDNCSTFVPPKLQAGLGARAASLATSLASSAKLLKPLTLWPLCFLIFFEVSGGPFGTEVGNISFCVQAAFEGCM